MQIGASRPLVLEKPEAVNILQAARYFGARGEVDAATMALLERCAVPLLAAATPRAVWLEADVDALTEVGILQGEEPDEREIEIETFLVERDSSKKYAE